MGSLRCSESEYQLTGTTKEEKLKNAIMLYADIEKWYADFLETEKGKECISEFDQVLPDYKGISKKRRLIAFFGV